MCYVAKFSQGKIWKIIVVRLFLVELGNAFDHHSKILRKYKSIHSQKHNSENIITKRERERERGVCVFNSSQDWMDLLQTLKRVKIKVIYYKNWVIVCPKILH